MNKTIADQSTTIRDMNNTIADQSKTIQEMKLTDKTMTSEISGVNQSLASLRSIARVEPNVFFSAVVSSPNGYVTLSTGKVIVFDKVISNEGNAYNKQNGIFTSPLDGFYFFELHAFPYGEHSFYLDLQHNGSKVISVNKAGSSGRGSASGSVTLKLRKHDQVKVVPWYPGGNVYGDSNNL